MNVFVLGTGRCGTLTFIRACKHLSNYTAGHETLAKCYGSARFAYPQWHIEADNRLCWLLGQLASRFDDREVFYVHLRRDPDAVALSHLRRWDNGFRASIIRAFGYGIVKRTEDWSDDQRLAVCRAYVDAVTANVDEFLRYRRSMTVWLEDAESTFPVFLDRIHAQGNLELALAEWRIVHNTSIGTTFSDPKAKRQRAVDMMVRRTSSSELLGVLVRRLRRRLPKTFGPTRTGPPRMSQGALLVPSTATETDVREAKRDTLPS